MSDCFYFFFPCLSSTAGQFVISLSYLSQASTLDFKRAGHIALVFRKHGLLGQAMTYASSKEMHAGCSFCVGDIDPTGCKLALGVCHSRTSFTPLFCMKDLHFIMCKECWQCISPSLRVLSRISRLSPTYLALTSVNAIHKCICVLHKSCAEC